MCCCRGRTASISGGCVGVATVVGCGVVLAPLVVSVVVVLVLAVPLVVSVVVVVELLSAIAWVLLSAAATTGCAGLVACVAVLFSADCCAGAALLSAPGCALQQCCLLIVVEQPGR